MCITDHFKRAGTHSACLSFVFFSSLSLTLTRSSSLTLPLLLFLTLSKLDEGRLPSMSSVNAWMYYCIIGPALFHPFIFVWTLFVDFIWAHWGSIMALRQLYMQHIPLCVLLKWVGSPARLPWTIFKPFQHKTDVSQQVPGANAAHTFSTWTCGCFFHPEMWTGHMSGWADLLRTGK